MYNRCKSLNRTLAFKFGLLLLSASSNASSSRQISSFKELLLSDLRSSLRNWTVAPLPNRLIFAVPVSDYSLDFNQVNWHDSELLVLLLSSGFLPHFVDSPLFDLLQQALVFPGRENRMHVTSSTPLSSWVEDDLLSSFTDPPAFSSVDGLLLPAVVSLCLSGNFGHASALLLSAAHVSPALRSPGFGLCFLRQYLEKRLFAPNLDDQMKRMIEQSLDAMDQERIGI